MPGTIRSLIALELLENIKCADSGCRLWHLFEVQRNEGGLVTGELRSASITGYSAIKS